MLCEICLRFNFVYVVNHARNELIKNILILSDPCELNQGMILYIGHKFFSKSISLVVVAAKAALP